MDEKIELIVSGVVAKITFNISLSFSMKVSHVAVISSLVIERLVASLTFIFLQCPLTFWNITLSSSNVICEMFDQPITEGTRLWLELYIDGLWLELYLNGLCLDLILDGLWLELYPNGLWLELYLDGLWLELYLDGI